MFATLADAAACGMNVAFHAARHPDVLAIASDYGERSFAELNARANQLARVLRANGLGEGSAIAVVVRNRPEFIEAFLAALRTGVRFTPVNWHLTAAEVGYVIDNCEADACVYEAGLGTAAEALDHASQCGLRLAVGGNVPGFVAYEAALATASGADIDDPVRGSQMLYTSGTTGRPKGVYRRQIPTAQTEAQTRAQGDPETDRCLCTGPAYHAAPLAFNIAAPMSSGMGIVLMDKWDPEEALRLIERYRITHTHMVATMFHRLLQLPEEVRGRYDLSSLKYVVHGAAPCPVHVKHAIIDWLGPVVFEYYAATEGGGNFNIDSETWLKKPGSVGQSSTPERVRILDDAGEEVPQGATGTIYFLAPDEGRFEYFKSPEKTAESYRGDWFTLGDMGYLDEDGFLFLNGRSAETIISGGVNIYPQEIDEVLLAHPQVQDVCTVGIPNEEWGEEVRVVVQLRPGISGSSAVSEDVLRFARSRLPGFKCPRSVDFVEDLPRLPSGKIQRRLVRAPYWEGRDRQI